MPLPVAALGNTKTYALYEADGLLRWAAFPWADAEPTFDAPGATFSLVAERLVRSAPEIVGEAPVMHTLVETETGKASVVDFLALRPGPDGLARVLHDRIVRVVEGRQGEVTFALRVSARPGGAAAPELAVDRNGLIWSGANESLVLQTEAELAVSRDVAEGHFTLKPGEKRHFVLTWQPDADPDVAEMQATEPQWDLDGTFNYWLSWSQGAAFQGPQRGHVLRLAALLKALWVPPAHQRGAVYAGPFRWLAPVALAAWGFESELTDALAVWTPVLDDAGAVQLGWMLEALSVAEASGLVEAPLLLPHWERLRPDIDALAARCRQATAADGVLLAAWAGARAGLHVAEDLVLSGDLVAWSEGVREGYQRLCGAEALDVVQCAALGLSETLPVASDDEDAQAVCWRVRALLATSGHVQARRLMDRLLLERSPFELAADASGRPDAGAIAHVLWTAAEVYLQTPAAPGRVELPDELGE